MCPQDKRTRLGVKFTCQHSHWPKCVANIADTTGLGRVCRNTVSEGERDTEVHTYMSHVSQVEGGIVSCWNSGSVIFLELSSLLCHLTADSGFCRTLCVCICLCFMEWSAAGHWWLVSSNQLLEFCVKSLIIEPFENLLETLERHNLCGYCVAYVDTCIICVREMSIPW